MLAARAGNTALVQLLLDRGADPTLTANDGLAAYHHVLSAAVSTPRYAQQKGHNSMPCRDRKACHCRWKGGLSNWTTGRWQCFW